MRSEMQGAIFALVTYDPMPPATKIQKLRGASMAVSTSVPLPPVYPSGAEMPPGDGQGSCENHYGDAIAEQDEGLIASDNHIDDALVATISELIALQRQRRFCIVSQSRCDRSVESFIAKLIGYSPEADEKSRKAVFTKASAFRKSVEKGGEGQYLIDDHGRDALSAAVPIIHLSATSREGWDNHRSQVEKRMRKLARTLPAWAFVESVAGFGDLGLAIIVGETGDLSNYATKERVWKRLGLAVIEGERQGRRSNAEEAAKHGYSPKRRSEIWTLADSMFKHQWRGAKEDEPAGPKGPYGEVYARRKAHTAHRDGWTPGRRDNDARRIMTKQLVEDLWKAWRMSSSGAQSA